MKKTVILLLIAACCLAFCSCGRSQEKSPGESQAETAPTESAPSKGDLLYEKYSSIIDALEEEDYQSAIAQINSLIPPPEYEEIVITVDNFWDYFEYREEFAQNKNTFGEIVTDFEKIVCGIALKEEYQSQLANASSVAVAFHADIVFESAEIDENRGSFEWTGITTNPPTPLEDTKDDDISIYCSSDSVIRDTVVAVISSPSGTSRYYERWSNIQINRVEGSIYLEK